MVLESVKKKKETKHPKLDRPTVWLDDGWVRWMTVTAVSEGECGRWRWSSWVREECWESAVIFQSLQTFYHYSAKTAKLQPLSASAFKQGSVSLKANRYAHQWLVHVSFFFCLRLKKMRIFKDCCHVIHHFHSLIMFLSSRWIHPSHFLGWVFFLSPHEPAVLLFYILCFRHLLLFFFIRSRQHTVTHLLLPELPLARFYFRPTARPHFSLLVERRQGSRPKKRDRRIWLVVVIRHSCATLDNAPTVVTAGTVLCHCTHKQTGN